MNGVAIINRIVNIVLHRELKFDENVPLSYLLGECVIRAKMMARGGLYWLTI